MDAPHRRALAEQLLLEQQLSRAAVDDRWRRCRAPGYWTDLAPGTSIGVRPSALDAVRLDRAALRVAEEQILVDGYCGVPRFLAPGALARVNAAIGAVMADGWPPVFAWVFDQLWASVRTAAVGGLLDAGLGAGARQVPHLWVHVVRAVVGARGWAPHMDGGLARGSRRRLSVWIALTEARVDNGCMYLLPRSQAPAGSVDFDWTTQSMRGADVIRSLNAVRAVPAAAGAALAWNFDILHWSGACTTAGEERRSLSLEFIARDEAPALDESPLLGCGPDDPLPSFPERLEYIARAILSYSKHEPAASRFRPLAERLLTAV